jgi:hypothetical protein
MMDSQGVETVFHLIDIIFMVVSVAVKLDHFRGGALPVIGDVEKIARIIKKFRLPSGRFEGFVPYDQPLGFWVFSRLLSQVNKIFRGVSTFFRFLPPLFWYFPVCFRFLFLPSIFAFFQEIANRIHRNF